MREPLPPGCVCACGGGGCASGLKGEVMEARESGECRVADCGDLGFRVGEVTLWGWWIVGDELGDCCCCMIPGGGCMCRGEVTIRGDSGPVPPYRDGWDDVWI